MKYLHIFLLFFHVVWSFIFVKPLSGELEIAGSGENSYTLGELVDIALKNNPKTKIAWWNAQRAAAALGSSQSAYYPTINLDANARYGNEFEFFRHSDRGDTMLRCSFILNLLLLDCGGRNASVNASGMALEAAKWESDWEIQKVMIAVLENAYALYYAQEALKASLTSRNDGAQVLEASVELNRAGATPITDVYTGKATLALLELEVIEKTAALDVQRGKLATNLGLSADYMFHLAPFSPLPEVHAGQIQELIALAEKQRRDLFAQQARLKEAIENQVVVKSSYLPQLSLLGNLSMQQPVGKSFDNRGGNYEIGVNLAVPLFTGFEASYQNRMAYTDVKISQETLMQLKLAIALEVVTYNRQLEATQKMLSQAKINLDYSKLAYDGVMEKYKAGQERLAELSNALRQLALARLRHSDVIAQYLSAIANLAYATGTL